MGAVATSTMAWRTFKPVSAILDTAILEAVELAGADGVTCQEIEELIDREHQAVSGNLRHLVEDGFVETTGTFGQTRSGRKANRYRLAPKYL